MSKFFFVGGTEGNTGPSNVNKCIVKNLTKEFSYIHSKIEAVKVVECFYKFFFCKVIIISGFSQLALFMMKIAKFLGKKSIFIMHGCIDLEAQLNELPVPMKLFRMEKEMIRCADLILPVSERFSEKMKKKYPQYKDKFAYLRNGVNQFDMKVTGEKEKGTIIAVGGDQKLKNNITVANAMKNFNIAGKLIVYGHLYEPDHLPVSDNIKFKGLVSQEELYKAMASSELYILNSLHESFSLSVFDAMACGCSVLITKEAGALELLDVTEKDIINNPMDEEEIAIKIKYLLQNPNNERLMKRIQFNEISYEASVQKLKSFCEKLV